MGTQEEDQDNSQLCTVDEAMRMLRRSRSKLYKLHRNGEIEMVKFGRRTTRVTLKSIERLVKRSDRPIGRGRAA